MEDHWLPSNVITTLPDGSMIVSPSKVDVCLFSLSTGSLLMGKIRNRDPATNSGDPVVSTDLSQYCKGYTLQAWRPENLEGSHRFFILVRAILASGMGRFRLWSVQVPDRRVCATQAGNQQSLRYP